MARITTALLALSLSSFVTASKEAGVFCIRNSGVAILSFGVKDLNSSSISRASGSVLSGQNSCIDLSTITGIIDGRIVRGLVKKATGNDATFSEDIQYKKGSPNRVMYTCSGTGRTFACSLQLPCSASPSASERQDDMYQCDRDCRWQFGFGDRSIVGRRTSWAGTFESKGHACCCQKDDTPLNYGGAIDRAFKKEFDTEDTWSGTDSTGFDSPWACVQNPSGGVETMDKAQARAQSKTIIHCGKCAVCSAMESVVVLPNTRKWVTYVMTKVSTKFAAPWGHKNVTLLEEDLYDLGVNFSIPLGPKDQSQSCMRCWSDNIMCDAQQCVSKCWTKFFDPTPTEECLQCDEQTCGPEFIKCAGANRRSTGIVSDIPRPDTQQCKDGVYFGVPDSDLPTLPKPSDQTINDVCEHNAHPSSIALLV